MLKRCNYIWIGRKRVLNFVWLGCVCMYLLNQSHRPFPPPMHATVSFESIIRYLMRCNLGPRQPYEAWQNMGLGWIDRHRIVLISHSQAPERRHRSDESCQVLRYLPITPVPEDLHLYDGLRNEIGSNELNDTEGAFTDEI